MDDPKKLAVFRGALKEARASFDQAKHELTLTESKAYWLKKDIADLRKTITALAAMCSETPWEDALGITESCAEAMAVEEGEVSTQAVVRRLEAMGFDFTSQKNPSASVHAVLTRLADRGVIEKLTQDGGGVTWRGPKYDPQSAEINDDDIPF
jgi:hypothetical protein